jgi:hypothetical protein
MFQGLVVRQACPELAEVAHHEREKSVRPEFIEGHGNPNLNFGTGSSKRDCFYAYWLLVCITNPACYAIRSDHLNKAWKADLGWIATMVFSSKVSTYTASNMVCRILCRSPRSASLP